MPKLEVAHYKWCAVDAPEELETVLTDVEVEEAEIDRLRDEVIAECEGPIGDKVVYVLNHAIAERILQANSRAVEDAVIIHMGGAPGHLSSWVIPESTALGGAILRSVEAWRVSK